MGLQKTLGEWPLRDYQPDHPLPKRDLGENRLPAVVGVPTVLLNSLNSSYKKQGRKKDCEFFIFNVEWSQTLAILLQALTILLLLATLKNTWQVVI